MGRPTRVRIRVPGSTANLGPGFDCLGMALGLYDEIDVEVQPTPGVFVDVAGEGSRFVPRDERLHHHVVILVRRHVGLVQHLVLEDLEALLCLGDRGRV